MFGQCASGNDWASKLGELQPSAFWGQWMQDSPISPYLIRSFFVPHRIERRKWELIARKAGLLFDRCRIASWACQERADCCACIAWTQEVLEQMGLGQ
jgi:hypothetical protein